MSHKKRPSLISQFISLSWQLSLKVSTEWQCSVHLVCENDLIFYSRVKHKWDITKTLSSSHFRVCNFQCKEKYFNEFWFVGLSFHVNISGSLSARISGDNNFSICRPWQYQYCAYSLWNVHGKSCKSWGVFFRHPVVSANYWPWSQCFVWLSWASDWLWACWLPSFSKSLEFRWILFVDGVCALDCLASI